MERENKRDLSVKFDTRSIDMTIKIRVHGLSFF